ncbi:FGGY-family carbohydrate kinase [Eubacterium callanderi]|uniref:FGGY-family carbohydrate kinase n=1 Tax=Eubacterium callanderi TaxID=53442 RepID=UPI001AA1AF0B|nr:FGGY family carbohydrate kinase [Eubacterium callanderi]MBO1701377.1 xylulose kinase [Eubacterium callanderi]
MKNYISGIDIGTTGVKVIIFDMEGATVGSAYREYPCTFPQSGWVEQDGEMTWQQTCEATREAIAKAGVDPAEIHAIGLSTQRCTFTPVDEAGMPLRSAISWQDSRSFEECEEIGRLVGAERYYEITGLPVGTTWSVSKIMWIKKHQPEIYEKTYKFAMDQERILNKLGAEGYFEDWSNGSLQGLMDIKAFEWSDELIDALELDKSKLPDLVPSGKVVGKISRESSTLTGFAEGTLLVSGGGDQQCAGIGAGAVKKGTIEVTIGTAGVTLAYMDEPIYDGSMRLPCSAHTVAGKWETEGLQNAAGSSLKWYRNEFAVPEIEKAKALGVDPYDLINEQVEAIAPGSDGLICIPYFASSAAPNWDPFARGTFIGLTLGHSRQAMARAIMEGVTYETREIIDQMITNGVEVNAIVLSGGAAKSDVWNHIQADIYGKTCSILAVEEATALGAAVLAALGAELYANVSEAVAHMVKIVAVCEPDMQRHALYNEYFEIYKDAYQALRKADVYERLVKLALK